MGHNYFGSQTMSQVALIVRDIEAKVKIYADLFGVEVPNIIETAPESEAHTRYHGEPTEARAKLAFFAMGSLTLELIEPIGGAEHLARLPRAARRGRAPHRLQY